MLCPTAVAYFSRNSGNAILEKYGEADMQLRNASLRSSAVMPYGSFGGGLKVIGK
jgi:hypothetical protein